MNRETSQIHDRQDLCSTPGDIHSDMDEKMRISDDETKKEGPMKRFYHKVVKPAFPEAITDIKIMFRGGMTALETPISRDRKNRSKLAFLAKRKAHCRDAFAKYIGVDPLDVNAEDVPTSYGEHRKNTDCPLTAESAKIGTLGYCEEMKQTGLWDCLTYVAGVSGSCWALATYYTFGKDSMQAVLDHCKKRFSPYHPLSGDAIRTLLSVPGGARITLGPLIQKRKSGLEIVAMDLYSVFTTGWIFFQDDPISHPGGHAQRKWSTARQYTDDGTDPLPIITAIRHERPWRDWEDKEHPFKDGDHTKAWFQMIDSSMQWFEMTPYEVGRDEIEAWVPTWGFGRPFEQGKSTMQLPEQSLALLLGLATSAPAGPLTSYISTISRNLPGGFLGSTVHKMAHAVTKFWGKDGTEEFQNHHPLHARRVADLDTVYHFSHVEPGKGRPPGLENSPRIHLIDSGMDNNSPTYVLLHPNRDADVIINMDASSNVQKDTFQERVDQIGSRRGLQFTKRHDIKPGEDEKDPHRFNGLYAQLYDGKPAPRPETVIDSYVKSETSPAPLSTKECTMIYMPLLPNEKAVPDFDPSTAKLSGSYNLVWTAEQVETLVKVCRANFDEAQGTIKEALHEAWQRKKAAREAKEEQR
ncbi:uncharacterized protein MYCFIDRAFT_169277 [Pseudocercospora fijiensis CIRAD86]|uniref:Lysophospholipase n=1 Tax=Pseudocercospora fijiensis (strain CIRAD86) TaxID=383855 RepID=N1Q5V7_PSEFD|nr:uncharacterized protein MYCFIDRAFT_169277 [Pseudocercospora fijiensis CIRAD86]EME87460.1 hypothetical protein MYCFIDRAFT_169277 [Pseudocercospora fijiensis CIRAD86]